MESDMAGCCSAVTTGAVSESPRIKTMIAPAPIAAPAATTTHAATAPHPILEWLSSRSHGSSFNGKISARVSALLAAARGARLSRFRRLRSRSS